jgi:hypothetical protein
MHVRECVCAVFWVVVRETAGQENVVLGPRVCEATGWRVLSWMWAEELLIVRHQAGYEEAGGRTSRMCTPSPCAATVTCPSEPALLVLCEEWRCRLGIFAGPDGPSGSLAFSFFFCFEEEGAGAGA